MAMDNDNIIDILDADGRANLKPKRYRRKYGNDEPAAGDLSELLKMQIPSAVTFLSDSVQHWRRDSIRI